jgi:translation initiation factor 2B subunit (eIF-2B alpha/beta/delta family)
MNWPKSVGEPIRRRPPRLSVIQEYERWKRKELMSSNEDLKAAITDLQAQLASNHNVIDGLLAKITHPDSSDADVEAAVTSIRQLISANQAELAKINPPATDQPAA